eukprot:TRINITY_DN3387_c0_g1_i2.p1 TRINITY_DN3387_c0_g1~~TRINITY_DN3387_c0_g1_i2.p1  ORF type:complete len:522 (-),score=114.44 TRINITY_DN3387_c0_g1_i2:169-1734(-)
MASSDRLKSPPQVKVSLPDDPESETLYLPHLTEWLNVEPRQSPYQTKSGCPLPDFAVTPSKWDKHDMLRLFVHDDDRVLLKVSYYGHPSTVGAEVDDKGRCKFKSRWAIRAGPRRWNYFDANEVKAAIVTCGGLCPGLNDVIRQIVYTLELYGVKEVLGIRYGFRGFVDPDHPPYKLNRRIVHDLNMQGGSFLGVSRGAPKNTDIADKLQEWGVNMFFVIGGNGSHAGANSIYQICRERKMKIVVVGIPKTIDNDIQLVDKTFGFDTAVEEAMRAINAGYVEASSAYNGIGVIKLMGRQSGFIAMHAALAHGQVDAVLIPEIQFVMEGKYGVLEYMKKRLVENGNCVVVIAEGAGQEHLENVGGHDPSGNPILGDIGKWFVGKVKAYFKSISMSVDCKYVDPTYMIRATACNSSDHIMCTVLGQNAVHGAFAGYSNFTVGQVNTHFCFLPIPEVIRCPRTVDINSNMWHRCLTATVQPDFVPEPFTPWPSKNSSDGSGGIIIQAPPTHPHKDTASSDAASK